MKKLCIKVSTSSDATPTERSEILRRIQAFACNASRYGMDCNSETEYLITADDWRKPDPTPEPERVRISISGRSGSGKSLVASRLVAWIRSHGMSTKSDVDARGHEVIELLDDARDLLKPRAFDAETIVTQGQTVKLDSGAELVMLSTAVMAGYAPDHPLHQKARRIMEKVTQTEVKA